MTTQRRARWLDRDDGMVSAELAAALPAVVFALLLVLGVAQHAITATRTQDAARVAARSAARGDPPARVQLSAQRAEPAAAVSVRDEGDRVRVVVTVPARGPTAWLVPSGSFTATAVAVREEAADGSD